MNREQLDAQMSYCAWRLALYCKLGNVTYNDIDAAVSEGRIKPGEMRELDVKHDREKEPSK